MSVRAKISCSGDGTCLRQCGCECYDPEDAKDDEDVTLREVCTCGHREHRGNCRNNNPCCEPVKCANYDFCHTELPLWVTHCHYGMCMNCASQLGRHKRTNDIEECPVCLEDKLMLLLRCNHKMCRSCCVDVYTSTHLLMKNTDLNVLFVVIKTIAVKSLNMLLIRVIYFLLSICLNWY